MLFKGPLVASVVVSTTDCHSRSHREGKSGLEKRTTSSLHLGVEILHLVVVSLVHLVHLVVESLVLLVHLVTVVVIVGRTWSAAVRKFR